MVGLVELHFTKNCINIFVINNGLAYHWVSKQVKGYHNENQAITTNRNIEKRIVLR